MSTARKRDDRGAIIPLDGRGRRTSPIGTGVTRASAIGPFDSAIVGFLSHLTAYSIAGTSTANVEQIMKN